MKTLTKLAVCLAFPLCGAVLNSEAMAATATATFPVTANVIDSCTVDATPLAFGNYNGISGAVLDGVSTISPICTVGTSYVISLDCGMGSGAWVTSRKLSGPGGATLSYGIFTDVTHMTAWGDGTGVSVVRADTGTGTARPLNVYGSIPAGQSVAVGSYSDTITVTVTY